ncbi:hypothetical protein [Marinomonas sp. IMCC 4694]|uniref:hypothetical protein n=1 Tax=Marinomonas sp. IMCC 4694 TaxID=2605432 RepID=UPI0011E61C39|nr:hypothetical protein [Marinomonas sp. IMCC 4694]TYL47871.1 hypothetical protein FXV75_07890 [Marinomonas sp. IMCC 4694]
MKIQLLMIMVMIASSLMTVSQRASGHEVSPFRWLEPTVEQTYNDVGIPDQDNGLDKGLLFLISSSGLVCSLDVVAELSDGFCATASHINSVNPRAPPFYMI